MRGVGAVAPAAASETPGVYRAGGPLRIGYLVQQFPPEVGAGPARVSETAVRWKAAGAEVTVITGMPNRPEGRIPPEYRGQLFLDEDWNGIRVLRSWLFASPRHGTLATIANNVSFMLTSALHGMARARRLDVLIASSPPFFVHLAGAAMRRVLGVPLVLEVRDLWPDYIVEMGIFRSHFGPAMLLALEQRLLRSADCVVGVTRDICERIENKGVAPRRVRLIPNGVDPARYYRSDEAAPLPAMRKQPGEFIVGYLGNFGAGQALETLVEAAAILADQDSTIRIVMAGAGTQRSQLEAKIGELRPSNLHLYPRIAKDQTRAFYNACDACLVPLAPLQMFVDAMPTKLLEIMACEVPVIAALEGEAAELVRNHSAGVVAEPGDPNALAGAIREVRSWDEARRRDAGRRGREGVHARYARDALAAEYLEVLRDVASVRGSVPGRGGHGITTPSSSEGTSGAPRPAAAAVRE